MKNTSFTHLLTAGAMFMGTGAALAAPVSITQAPFGTLADGGKATLYTLTNARGSQVKITNYGGVITSVRVPDKRGKLGDVVLGFDTLDEYVKSSPYFGAIVGRYGNRIAKGRFELDGKVYDKLAINNKPNTLHGGIKGFDKVIWSARPMKTKNGPALELRYFSKNGEEGYPGNLQNRVLYTFGNDNQLRMDFRAVTDAPTVVNLTNHAYFNLAGKGTILNHKVKINANRFVPIDATSIPLGNLAKVAGTPFDFRKSTAVGARIDAKDQQIVNGSGYDHTWVLNGSGHKLKMAAQVNDPSSGRVLTVYTTQPGVQFYTGNFLGKMTGKGQAIERRSALCLEAQHYPDSPNQPQFPSTTLRPGQTYRETIIYAFSTR